MKHRKKKTKDCKRVNQFEKVWSCVHVLHRFKRSCLQRSLIKPYQQSFNQALPLLISRRSDHCTFWMRFWSWWKISSLARNNDHIERISWRTNKAFLLLQYLVSVDGIFFNYWYVESMRWKFGTLRWWPKSKVIKHWLMDDERLKMGFKHSLNTLMLIILILIHDFPTAIDVQVNA